MIGSRPIKDQLKKIAQQIEQDQNTTTPAEKRVKIDTAFDKAIKKMGQTPSPKKEGK